MTTEQDDLATKIAIVWLAVAVGMIGTALLMFYVILPWIYPRP